MKLGRGLDFPSSEKSSRKWYVMHYGDCWLVFVCLNLSRWSVQTLGMWYKNSLTSSVIVPPLYTTKVVNRRAACLLVLPISEKLILEVSAFVCIKNNHHAFHMKAHFKTHRFKELKPSEQGDNFRSLPWTPEPNQHVSSFLATLKVGFVHGWFSNVMRGFLLFLTTGTAKNLSWKSSPYYRRLHWLFS